jgi:hypothetical protein
MPRIFFGRGLSSGNNAGQMLLETQVRLAGESVWVRTDCSEKTVYFPSDFVLTLGVRYKRTWRVMLCDLHLLLPALGQRTWPTRAPLPLRF